VTEGASSISSAAFASTKYYRHFRRRRGVVCSVTCSKAGHVYVLLEVMVWRAGNPLSENTTDGFNVPFVADSYSEVLSHETVFLAEKYPMWRFIIYNRHSFLCTPHTKLTHTTKKTANLQAVLKLGFFVPGARYQYALFPLRNINYELKTNRNHSLKFILFTAIIKIC